MGGWVATMVIAHFPTSTSMQWGTNKCEATVGSEKHVQSGLRRSPISSPSCVGHSPPVSCPWNRLDSNSSSAAVALR